jgi:large subunit ribosomal protein L21e
MDSEERIGKLTILVLQGMIALGTYLKPYKVGDIVDIKANGAVQKGMPHKVYHGKTGVIYNVTRSAVGVIIYKKVGNRYMEKRVNVRVEHIARSRSREECKFGCALRQPREKPI